MMKRTLAPFLIIALMIFSGSVFAADIQYAFTLNWSAIPNPIQFRKVTFKVNLGTVTSATVTQDGVPLSCTYSATTKDVMFTATNGGTNILVTGINQTVAGTGAISKCVLYEDKRWAYSFTFDDSYTTQNTVALPIFKARGYRGGIGLISDTAEWGGSYLTWPQLDELYNEGWSIMNHSAAHVDDGSGGYSDIRCPGDPDYDPLFTIATQVKTCKDAIEARYPGYKVTHYVYPYNDIAYQSCLTSSGLMQSAEAGVHDNYADTIPTVGERFNLGREQFYGTDITTFNSWPTAAYTDSVNNNMHRWLIAFTHGVVAASGATGAYNTNATTLQAHVNYIYTNYGEGGNKSMWFAPTDEVFNYLLCRTYITAVSVIVGSPTVSPTISPTHTITMTRTITPTVTVSPTMTQTFTSSPTPCGEVVMYRVSAGNSGYEVDSMGFTWAADKGWSAGTWGFVNGTADMTYNGPISGVPAADAPVYQAERYGASSYRFTVPNGTYKVDLLLAENYCAASNCRIFDVRAEGTVVVDNLDIYSKVGANAALNVTFTAAVADGELTLEGVVVGPDVPKWSGIKIARLTTCNSPTETAVVSATVTRTVTQTVTVTSTFTETAQVSATLTPSVTQTHTAGNTQTCTATVTPSGTLTITMTVTKTNTPVNTPNGTLTVTPTVTQTAIITYSPTPTMTLTHTHTPVTTYTFTMTVTPTLDVTAVNTPTYTPTAEAQGETPSNYIDSVIVYPNPFNEKATVKYILNGAVEAAQLTVYTNSFRKIYSAQSGAAKGENTIVLPVESLKLSNGIYFYRLSVKPAEAKQETKAGTVVRLGN